MQMHEYTAPIFERTPNYICIHVDIAKVLLELQLLFIHLNCFALLQMKGGHYPFPHSRIKLQRDPKDHTVSGMFS